MDLKQKIKKDQVEARKARDANRASILTVMLGEIETREKRDQVELTSAEIIAIMKKLIESCEMTGETESIEVLSGYLPKQLTEDQMREIIMSLGKVDMKTVMNHLKEQYGGQYDGKMASTIAKE